MRHYRRILAAAAAGLAAVTVVGTTGAGAATRTTKKTTKTTKKATATTKAATTAPAATTATTAPATTRPAAGAVTGKRGGDFIDVRTFTSGDPTTIDPGRGSVVNESQVANLLFDGLVDIDYNTNELKGAVAQSWSSNATADVWTFKLKSGVKFTNGEPVLPSNFKCAWDRAVAPSFASALSYHFNSVRGKNLVDDGKATSMSGVVADDGNMTLTVTLNYPYSDFAAEMQHTVFSPLTKAGCAAGRDYHDTLMVGNGPFKLAEPWKRGQYIKVVRNDDYYGGINGTKAFLDSVEFKILRDELAALNLFESGSGDAGPIPAGRYNELTKKYGDGSATKAQLAIQYLGLNWQDPTVGGFGNAKLRQAISAAIDRKQINDAVFDASRKEATGFTPPGIDGVKETSYGVKTTADVATAKKLLQEWGKPVPTIKMRCVNTPINAQICSIIRNNLKDAGIDVDVDLQPGTGYFDRVRENPGMAFRAGWAADFVGYDNFMYPLFHGLSVPTCDPVCSGDNLFRFGVAEVDNLITQARRSTDPKRKADFYFQAEKVIMEQMIAVPLWWNKWATIVSKRVDRFVQGPTAFIDYSLVTMK